MRGDILATPRDLCKNTLNWFNQVFAPKSSPKADKCLSRLGLSATRIVLMNFRDINATRRCPLVGSNMGGLTLPELLIGLSLLAVLTTTAVSGLQNLLLNVRLQQQVHTFRKTLQTARHHALLRLTDVVVCPAGDNGSCSSNWNNGFTLVASDSEQLLFEQSNLATGIAMQANRSSFTVRPLERSTNGTVLFCDRRGQVSAIAVVISYTGTSRTTSGVATSLQCT